MLYIPVTLSCLHTLKTVKYNNFYFQSATIFLRTPEQNIPLVQTFALRWAHSILVSWFSLGAFSFCLNHSLSRHIHIQCLGFPLSQNTLIYAHSWRKLSGECRIPGWQFSVSTLAVFAQLLALLVSGQTSWGIKPVFPCRQFRDFAYLLFFPFVFLLQVGDVIWVWVCGFIPFGVGSTFWACEFTTLNKFGSS